MDFKSFKDTVGQHLPTGLIWPLDLQLTTCALESEGAYSESSMIARAPTRGPGLRGRAGGSPEAQEIVTESQGPSRKCWASGTGNSALGF